MSASVSHGILPTLSASKCPSSCQDGSHNGLGPTLITLITSARTPFPNKVIVTGKGGKQGIKIKYIFCEGHNSTHYTIWQKDSV